MTKVPTTQLNKYLTKLNTRVVEAGQTAHQVFARYQRTGATKIITGGCGLNSTWVSRLGVDDIKDRDKRRQARKLLAQLEDAADALWNEKLIADGKYDGLIKTLKSVSGVVQGDFEEAIIKLESWVKGMTDRGRVIDYNLKELTKLVTSKAPARARKCREQKMGDQTMAKKESIPNLLKELAGTDDQDEKRLIRKKLRALGHTGGLGKKVKKVVKKTKKVVKKKAVKK